MFNGILCSTASSAGTCSTTKTIHVRRSLVISFSTGTPADPALFDSSLVPASAITLPSCTTAPADNTMPTTDYFVRIVDEYGNAMPTGTTVAFSTDNGTLLSPASYVVPNEGGGCNSAFAGCPAASGSATFGNYKVSLRSDATYDTATTACTNTNTTGKLTVTVTSPSGLITPITFTVAD
jgi:hypothetical protein